MQHGRWATRWSQVWKHCPRGQPVYTEGSGGTSARKQRVPFSALLFHFVVTAGGGVSAQGRPPRALLVTILSVSLWWKIVYLCINVTADLIKVERRIWKHEIQRLRFIIPTENTVFLELHSK